MSSWTAICWRICDVTIIALSLHALKKMISVFESYAERYHITFNPTKSKLLCFNIDPTTLDLNCLNKQLISNVLLTMISILEDIYLMTIMIEILYLVFVIFINNSNSITSEISACCHKFCSYYI